MTVFTLTPLFGAAWGSIGATGTHHLAERLMVHMVPLLALAPETGEAAGHGHGAATAVAPIVSPVAPVLFALVWIALVVTVIAMLLTLVQVLRGPHLADRVLSGDVMTFQVVGMVLLLGIYLGTTVVFDVALTVGIIGFASTLAFAQFIAARDRSSGATT